MVSVLLGTCYHDGRVIQETKNEVVKLKTDVTTLKNDLRTLRQDISIVTHRADGKGKDIFAKYLRPGDGK